jgi:ABC-2 type transport system ATP-binding protein
MTPPASPPLLDDPDAAIVVDGLTKVFRRGDAPAVDGLSFTVRRGAVTGLLGGNGAGKTTTISMLLGLLLPTAGAIRLLGRDMIADRHAALPRMNFSSPYVDLPGRLTVREVLTVFAHLYAVTDVRGTIARLAADLDLEGLTKRPVNTLSAGQKTRVALAKALVNAPDLLLLDEPTASLDPDTGDRLRRYLGDYARRSGATLFLASHNMGEVEFLCDDVMVMRAGRIHDRDTPAGLVARYGRRTLEEVFLDIARGAGRAGRDGEQAARAAAGAVDSGESGG